MAEKWILIVDDEESILAVLKSSLKRLGPDYRVVTVTNGHAALEQIRAHRFDLVVTDYKMAGMDGLLLLEKLHSERPDIRVILMTAYGSNSVEAEAARLKVYKYLAKPLEIEAFRQIVKEAVGQNKPGAAGLLVLSEKDYREVVQVLRQLQAEVGARYCFLTNQEGRYIAYTGMDDNFNFTKVATLLGGSLTTLIEAGRSIDNDDEAVNLAYRESQKGSLYVVNVWRQYLLVILIDRSPFSSRLGSVWYSAQATVKALRAKLETAEYENPENLLGEGLEAAIAGGLDDLFSGGAAPRPAVSGNKPVPPTGSQPGGMDSPGETGRFPRALR